MAIMRHVQEWLQKVVVVHSLCQPSSLSIVSMAIHKMPFTCSFTHSIVRGTTVVCSAPHTQRDSIAYQQLNKTAIHIWDVDCLYSLSVFKVKQCGGAVLLLVDDRYLGPAIQIPVLCRMTTWNINWLVSLHTVCILQFFECLVGFTNQMLMSWGGGDGTDCLGKMKSIFSSIDQEELQN